MIPNMIRNRKLDVDLALRGRFQFEHYRDGKLFNIYDILNDIVNEGKNKIFNTMFNDSTPVANASWCIGLISATGFSALAATDTMASHPGWTEFTSFTQANRVAWGSGNSVAQQATNATPATFNINAAGTLKGGFVVSNNTKGGTSGILWATAQFSSDIPVTNGDEMKITYTVNA